MTSLIEDYNAYRTELFPAEGVWPSGLQFMLRGKLNVLFAGRESEEIKAFVTYAESNGYFAVERDAIRSAAADILND